MRSSTFRMETVDDLGGALVHYTPGERGGPRVVGLVRPLPDGTWRARNEDTNEVVVAATRTEAAVGILPDDGFPELCVICEKNEPVVDAAAYEFRGPRGRTFYAPSDLDDVCEDCLPDAVDDYLRDYEP